MTAKPLHYRKDVLRPGEFIDQKSRFVRFTEPHVHALAIKMNEAIGDGVKIPVVVGDSHPLDINESTPDLDEHPDVVGFVDMAAVQSSWLKADIKSKNGDAIPNLPVSAWTEPEVTAPNGKTYRPFIRHVLLSDDVAVKDQTPMALLHSPEAPNVSIFTSHVGSDLSEKEKSMKADELLGSIRAKLKLPEAAEGDAILGAIDSALKPPAPPALLASVRTKLGVATDAKDDDVIAKVDELLKRPADAKEEEIPAAMLAQKRDIDSRLVRVERREFHQSVDGLMAGNAMKITPAMARKLKERYPTEATEGSALLAPAQPMTEAEVQKFILNVLSDLPAKNVIAPGATLRVADGQLPAGGELTEAKAQAEADKTLRAAGHKV